MLQLKKISKEYSSGGERVLALREVSLQFRDSEFVSILGPSGCGKTTLLNIIGGLDASTDGEMWIEGRSTKCFQPKDWDSYRNHRVGFVFQSYHLIPHLNILENVELALTLSGVSRKQRHERAKDALKRVGLLGHLRKKPTQLSGGQMQRVAIARALVNDPDIILADEPTGALDSQTSHQVMQLLQDISRERLVIMVTHNPELAERYSTRILRMMDGEITEDSSPVEQAALENPLYTSDTEHLTGMSPATAIGLSLRNLFTKKGRVALTAFAGSIGIIGIALVIAISQGTGDYIQKIQEDTLTAYPLTLEANVIDFGDVVTSFAATTSQQEHFYESNTVAARPILYHLAQAMQKLQGTENDLHGFYVALQNQIRQDAVLRQALIGVTCTYSLDLPVYRMSDDGKIQIYDSQVFLQNLVRQQIGGNGSEMPLSSGNLPISEMGQMLAGEAVTMWSPMLEGMDGEMVSPLLQNQYELLSGNWPERYDQVMVVVDENNTLDELTLYALGLKSQEEMEKILLADHEAGAAGENTEVWRYEQIIGLEMRVVPSFLCYAPDEETNAYTDLRDTEEGLQALYESGIRLHVTGIIRPRKGEDSTLLRGTIGYTQALVSYLAERGGQSEVITAQLHNPEVDILSGLPFCNTAKDLGEARKAELFRQLVEKMDVAEQSRVYERIRNLTARQQPTRAQMEESLLIFLEKQMQSQQVAAYMAALTDAELTQLYQSIQTQQQTEQAETIKQSQQLLLALPEYTQEQCSLFFDEAMTFSENTLDGCLQKLGYIDPKKPEAIHLYAASFEQKAVIVEVLEQYNASVQEEKQIHYTDYVGLIMSSVSTMLKAVTWVLVGFVGISLIVSSIMISVITMISVQERTKEIGILRAMGASKRDVSGVFLAETGLIGFASGILGVSLSLAFIGGINGALGAVTDMSGLQVYLSWQAGGMLIAVSVGLTLLAGIIPSGHAAGKDPVAALRTE